MNNLVLFEQKQVRRVWNEADQKWYFAVQDVIEILTGSADVKQYVKKLKSRDPEMSSNWGTICTLVEMTAADGKKRKIELLRTRFTPFPPGTLRERRPAHSRSPRKNGWPFRNAARGRDGGLHRTARSTARG